MAIDFDGCTDEYTGGPVIPNITGNTGFGFWARPDDIVTDQYAQDHCANRHAIILGFQNCNWNVFCAGYPTGTAADTQQTATVDVWQHVWYQSDGTNVEGYIDGTRNVNVTANLNHVTGNLSFNDIASSGAADRYNGELAWLSHYEEFFTQNQVAAMANGANTFGFAGTRNYIVPLDGDVDNVQAFGVLSGSNDGNVKITKQGSPTKGSGNPPVELMENYL